MANQVGYGSIGKDRIGIDGDITIGTATVESTTPALANGENLRYLSIRDTLSANNPNKAFREDENRILRILFTALARTLDDFEDQVARAQRGFHVETAQDDALDLLGKSVNTPRPTGEGDGRYRTRVRAGFGRATSKTTIRDFGVIAKLVLQASKDDITIEGVTDKPVILVEVDVTVLKDSLFTTQEIVDLLKDSVASGHNIQLQSVGTFVFDGPNYSPDANTGFNEGTFGGNVSG